MLAAGTEVAFFKAEVEALRDANRSLEARIQQSMGSMDSMLREVEGRRRDIELKSFELESLAELVTRITESIHDIMLVTGLDGRVLRASRSALIFFGVPEKQLIGIDIDDLLDPADLARLRQRLPGQQWANRPLLYELIYADERFEEEVVLHSLATKPATETSAIEKPHLCHLLHGSVLYDQRGKEEGLILLASDISSVKHREALAREHEMQKSLDVLRDTLSLLQQKTFAVTQSEQRFSTAFSSCPVAASIAAAEDGRFMEANENYERDFGWTRDDLIGRTSVEVGLWPDQATRETWAEEIRLHGRLVNYETVWMHKNGERRNVSLSAEFTELNGKPCILAYATDITARKHAEQILAASEIRLRAVLDGVQSGVVVINENGIVESFNQSAEQMFAYSADEVVGHNVNMLIPEPHKTAHDGYLADYQRSGIRKIIGQRRDVLARRKDGSIFPIELGVTETLLNKTKFFIGSIHDISFRREAEAELRIAATAFESQEGMVVTDPDGVILRVNKAFTELSGYSAEEAIGQTPRLLKSGRHNADFYHAMWETIKTTGGWQGEIWDRRKDGTEYPKWLTISAVVGDDGVVTHYVGTHLDITERKIAEDKINELAFYDPLTRLPNRTLLLDRLRQAMTAGSRSGNFGSLLFMDLDNFKTLNDTLGHDIGDLLLQQVAQRISASVREGDTVARLGGDEFVVVLESLSGNAEEAATQTEAIGGKILATLNRPYQLKTTEYQSTASIGATLFRGHLDSIDDLMKQADLAMYKSKQTGRNALHFFDPVMQTLLIERSVAEANLRRAIEEHQFLLHYQAQVVDEGRVTGVEALVRWMHPKLGMVPPAKFISLAEETGQILPLGQWVLEVSCAQLALWATQPEMAHLTMAVNVSAKEFCAPDFVLNAMGILNKTGADPTKLKLELTESLLVDNVEDVIEKMVALKSKGVGFALDDFGTGYSSLSYLKRLPLDQLKIDRSFVRDVLVDPNDAAIARTVVALAQNLGLGVIAEGVETEAQRVFLANSGCHAYQGYFFSRPLPLADFEAFIRRV